jgi:hypothetical protein
VEPLGGAVSLIEPGNYNSQIGVSAVARTGGDPKLADRSRYKEPDEVALAVEQALFELFRAPLMVVPDQHEAEITIRKAIEELVQLNEGQNFTYSRDALVGLLDEALKTARPATTAASTTAAPTPRLRRVTPRTPIEREPRKLAGERFGRASGGLCGKPLCRRGRGAGSRHAPGTRGNGRVRPTAARG